MNLNLSDVTKTKSHKLFGFLSMLMCLFVFSVSTLTIQAASYNPDNIPMPKIGHYPMYTSNPDNILSPESVGHIEGMLHMLEDSACVKAVVVVVERLDGDDPQQFSLQTYNKYGVGDAKNNRGFLLTLASLDRSYYITTGYGLESELTDAICRRVGYRVIEPRAKEGDWNGAVVSAIDTICAILTHNSLTVESFSGDGYSSYDDGYEYEDEELGPVGQFMVNIMLYGIVLFFMGMGIRFVLFFPNLLYLHFHKEKNVQIKNPNSMTNFLLDCVDSFWNTGNKYYYVNENGARFYYNVSGIPWLRIFLFILSCLFSGSSSGGRGGRGGSSHGGCGGGRSGGGGAGGRF